MNFTEYWERNEQLYEQLGVTKAAAYRIWCDAIDALMGAIETEYFIGNIKLK
jgi:hypothetical protein